MSLNINTIVKNALTDHTKSSKIIDRAGCTVRQQIRQQA